MVWDGTSIFGQIIANYSRFGLSQKHSCVIRAYDNRVRQTSRSPYLYHHWAKIKDGTKRVLEWTEEGSTDATIEFRDKKYASQSCLFRSDKLCGKVEVIAVPFISGSHYCSTVKEALCLIRFLKNMHADGFVHGDISMRGGVVL